MEETTGVADSAAESDCISFLMEDIYKSCCVSENDDSVLVSSLIDYMRPHMVHYPTGISDIQQLLDPKKENPTVGKRVFYEAMRKWIASIKECDNNSRGSSDSERKFFPFSQSTPTQSSSEENISNINISTMSPTSFDGDKSNSGVERDMQLLKQQLKTLNIAHSSTLNELSTVKQQLTKAEQSVIELRKDLERTCRRLSHEQQTNAELQKYVENKDDSHDDKTEAAQKLCDLQKVLASTKKENSNLVSLLKNLEVQVEQNEAQIVELRKKDESRIRELANLQTTLEEYEEENRVLTQQLTQIGEELKEEKRNSEHHREVSNMYKDELEATRQATRKSDKRKSRNSLPSLHGLGTLTRSPKKQSLNKITPYKNLYRPSEFDREIFNSPVFLRQLLSPISPDGLDTPTSKTVSETMSTLLGSADRIQTSLSETPDESSEVIENELSGLVEDSFDSSAYSDDASKGLSLLSEIKSCTFLNDGNASFDNEENLRIIKEHENCPKILQEYQEQIEMFEEKLMIAVNEYNDLLIHTENMEMEILEKHNSKNEELLKEISNLKKELDEKKNEELIKTLDFQVKYNEICGELEGVKNEQENARLEYNDLQKNYECLIHEKETLQNFLEEIKSENNILVGKLNEMNEALALKDEEIHSITHQKALLKEEIYNLNNEQERNSHELEMLTEKLCKLNDLGKKNVQIVKLNITNMNTKVQFLKDFTDKLAQTVDEVQGEHQLIKSKLKLIQTSEDSSSNDANEERPQFRKKSKKRTDNELQFKINKFEDHVNFLERKLSAEKLKSAQIFDLEARIVDLERENSVLVDEKREVFKRLERTLEELDEKQEIFEKVVRQNALLSLENEKMGVAQVALDGKTATLEENLKECLEEKKQLSFKVQKQSKKIFALMKSVADMEKLYRATKSVENLVHDQESLMQFNKHQLMKSASSLELAQKRVIALELLQSKSNMVLLETIKIFRATKTIYEAWKHSLESKADEQLVENAKTLDFSEIPHDLTEQDIWNVHKKVIVSCQLLEALAINVRPKDEHAFSGRNISKFTMKNDLVRLPSCDPDISSSIKEDSSANYEEITEIENGVVIEDDDESSVSTLYHRGNRREASNERKKIEKKFWLLVSSWKTDCLNAKNKYSCSRRECMQLRESFLINLLKIVTCIKEHKCYREQESLIQALTFVEKLKDVLSDVFKMAEKYGASRQELRTMKRWNLILKYVNGNASARMVKELQDTSFTSSEDSKSCQSLIIRTTKPEETEGMNMRSLYRSCIYFLIFCVVFVTLVIAFYSQLKGVRKSLGSGCPFKTLVRNMGGKYPWPV